MLKAFDKAHFNVNKIKEGCIELESVLQRIFRSKGNNNTPRNFIDTDGTDNCTV